MRPAPRPPRLGAWKGLAGWRGATSALSDGQSHRRRKYEEVHRRINTAFAAIEREGVVFSYGDVALLEPPPAFRSAAEGERAQEAGGGLAGPPVPTRTTEASVSGPPLWDGAEARSAQAQAPRGHKAAAPPLSPPLTPEDAATVSEEAARFAAEARSLVRTASKVTAEAERALLESEEVAASEAVEQSVSQLEAVVHSPRATASTERDADTNGSLADDVLAQQSMEEAFDKLHEATGATIEGYADAVVALQEQEGDPAVDAAMDQAFGELHEAVERTIENYSSVAIDLLELGGAAGGGAASAQIASQPTMPHQLGYAHATPAQPAVQPAPAASVAAVAEAAARAAVEAALPGLAGRAAMIASPQPPRASGAWLSSMRARSAAEGSTLGVFHCEAAFPDEERVPMVLAVTDSSAYVTSPGGGEVIAELPHSATAWTGAAGVPGMLQATMADGGGGGTTAVRFELAGGDADAQQFAALLGDESLAVAGVAQRATRDISALLSQSVATSATAVAADAAPATTPGLWRAVTHAAASDTVADNTAAHVGELEGCELYTASVTSVENSEPEDMLVGLASDVIRFTDPRGEVLFQCLEYGQVMRWAHAHTRSVPGPRKRVDVDFVCGTHGEHLNNGAVVELQFELKDEATAERFVASLAARVTKTLRQMLAPGRAVPQMTPMAAGAAASGAPAAPVAAQSVVSGVVSGGVSVDKQTTGLPTPATLHFAHMPSTTPLSFDADAATGGHAPIAVPSSAPPSRAPLSAASLQAAAAVGGAGEAAGMRYSTPLLSTGACGGTTAAGGAPLPSAAPRAPAPSSALQLLQSIGRAAGLPPGAVAGGATLQAAAQASLSSGNDVRGVPQNTEVASDAPLVGDQIAADTDVAASSPSQQQDALPVALERAVGSIMSELKGELRDISARMGDLSGTVAQIQARRRQSAAFHGDETSSDTPTPEAGDGPPHAATTSHDADAGVTDGSALLTGGIAASATPFQTPSFGSRLPRAGAPDMSPPPPLPEKAFDVRLGLPNGGDAPVLLTLGEGGMSIGAAGAGAEPIARFSYDAVTAWRVAPFAPHGAEDGTCCSASSEGASLPAPAMDCVELELRNASGGGATRLVVGTASERSASLISDAVRQRCARELEGAAHASAAAQARGDALPSARPDVLVGRLGMRAAWTYAVNVLPAPGRGSAEAARACELSVSATAAELRLGGGPACTLLYSQFTRWTAAPLRSMPGPRDCLDAQLRRPGGARGLIEMRWQLPSVPAVPALAAYLAAGVSDVSTCPRYAVRLLGCPEADERERLVLILGHAAVAIMAEAVAAAEDPLSGGEVLLECTYERLLGWIPAERRSSPGPPTCMDMRLDPTAVPPGAAMERDRRGRVLELRLCFGSADEVGEVQRLLRTRKVRGTPAAAAAFSTAGVLSPSATSRKHASPLSPARSLTFSPAAQSPSALDLHSESLKSTRKRLLATDTRDGVAIAPGSPELERQATPASSFALGGAPAEGAAPVGKEGSPVPSENGGNAATSTLQAWSQQASGASAVPPPPPPPPPPTGNDDALGAELQLAEERLREEREALAAQTNSIMEEIRRLSTVTTAGAAPEDAVAAAAAAVASLEPQIQASTATTEYSADSSDIAAGSDAQRAPQALPSSPFGSPATGLPPEILADMGEAIASALRERQKRGQDLTPDELATLGSLVSKLEGVTKD